ncbi:acyltransferase family protein [Bifidobacterium vespertilionis]|uniref:acyltransferase family protein n=1 Tax=Bifidobacterium vespertilionis TaxID=2562524 RepID=UPI001BDD10AF|nr:acyltransferase [Bifidobacterium vespertilionis]MBT1179938.1 acyltransferase [Bifidobacterium vespertilionis]
MAEARHAKVQSEASPSWSRAYDAGKAVAIVLVVLAHVTRWYTGQGVNTPVQPSRPLALLTNYIYMFHMPLFIFVSGGVYGICIDKGKYRDGARFLLNKIHRLLIPYYIWGMLVVAPLMVGLGFAHSSYLHYAWKSIVLAEDGRHLWFIFTLFMLFVIAMLIRPVILRYDLVSSGLILGVGLVLFFASPHVGYIFQFANICKYFIFFMAGVYANHMLASRELNRQMIFWAGIIGFVILSISYVVYYRVISAYIFVLTGAFGGIAVMLAIAWWLQSSDRIFNSWLLRNIRKNAYGIFFIHVEIIYTAFKLFDGKAVNPVLFTVVVFLVAFTLSDALTAALRKVHLGFVLGE